MDHITISGSVLQALADDKDVADFRGEDLNVDVEQSQAKVAGRGQSPFGQSEIRLIELDVHAVDMLANDGKAVDDSNNADASVKQRLEYALK